MACDSRESSKSICKEIALQRPKTGKFDYLGRPNYPAHSIAFKFFTNDSARYAKSVRATSIRAIAIMTNAVETNRILRLRQVSV
jgi:hypothetical protein